MATVVRIESGIDRAASMLFAFACGYAAFTWFARAALPVTGAEILVAFGLAYVIALRVLSAVRPAKRKLPVPIFDVREVDAMDAPQLLLTKPVEQPAPSQSDEALMLDDILDRLGPDSRVVRLFDPAAMPTAGLKSRIDRHVDGELSEEQGVDAAQALHDALAELRRSIR
ncbi:MAG TPA: hypothetical protein VGM04_05775 [Sphingomicrobium sp.]